MTTLQRCYVKLLAFSLLAGCFAHRQLISKEYLKNPNGIDVVQHMFDQFYDVHGGGDIRCLYYLDSDVLPNVKIVGDTSGFISYTVKPGIVKLMYTSRHSNDKVMHFCTLKGIKDAKKFLSDASAVSLRRVDVEVWRPQLTKVTAFLEGGANLNPRDSQKYKENLDEAHIVVGLFNQLEPNTAFPIWLEKDYAVILHDSECYRLEKRDLAELFSYLMKTFKTITSFYVPNPVGGELLCSRFTFSSQRMHTTNLSMSASLNMRAHTSSWNNQHRQATSRCILFTSTHTWSLHTVGPQVNSIDVFILKRGLRPFGLRPRNERGSISTKPKSRVA